MAFETFARPTGIEWGSADRTYGQVKFGDDSQLVVIFYTKAVFNAALSQEKGVRQYENQTWIKMHPPGERLNIIDRPVENGDKNRFPRQWNLFLQNKSQIPDGTPIDLLFANNPAIADNLRAFGVHTIQQCANLSAHAMDTIGMGANDWKNMAKQYLENAKSGAAFLQLKSEVAQKDQEIKLLKRQFEQLKSQHDDIINRLKDPNTSTYNTSGLQPSYVEGYDVQADRLNANHPSQEIKKSKKKVNAPPKDEVDQSNVIKQVTEEDFNSVDVTKDQQLDFGFKENK